MIPTEFKGTLYIYWLPDHDVICFSAYGASDDAVNLGKVEIDVKFDADKATAAAVDAIDAQIEAEREASAHRIAVMQQRKQELLAIGFDGGEG